MYADRNARPSGVNAGSLVVAVAINAAVIGALIFSAPVIEAIKQRGSLIVENIPLDPPPPPEPIEPPPAIKDQKVSTLPERPSASTNIAPTTASDAFVVTPLPLPPLPLPPLPPVGELTRVEPPKPPVLVEARPDPRFARQMQPTYPPGERRAEREGVVTMRVTIGRDGRVLNADCVSATSDEFCRATRLHALAKWRFQPATRDGVAVEATKELTVRFQLES